MIGLLIPPDRWTCPDCHRTEVPQVDDDAALARAIRRAQERHGRQHAGEREAVRDAARNDGAA